MMADVAAAGRAEVGEVRVSEGESSNVSAVPVATMLWFLLGCGVMVGAAASIMSLSEWAERWGAIPVFLVFFVIVGLGGRWFWGGIDALIAAARGEDQR